MLEFLQMLLGLGALGAGFIGFMTVLSRIVEDKWWWQEVSFCYRCGRRHVIDGRHGS